MSEHVGCDGCTRRFPSKRAKKRHLKSNPTHDPTRLTNPPFVGETWVQIGGGFETFLTVPEGTGPEDITVDQRG